MTDAFAGKGTQMRPCADARQEHGTLAALLRGLASWCPCRAMPSTPLPAKKQASMAGHTSANFATLTAPFVHSSVAGQALPGLVLPCVPQPHSPCGIEGRFPHY